MARSDIDQSLARIPILSECSKRELKAISKLVTPVEVKAGTTLTEEGAPAREFMIIVSGEASVHRDGRRIAALGPGDFFGEVAMLAGAPRTATVIADTDMVIEVFNRREFSSLLDESPKLAKKILTGAVKRLYENDQKRVH